jgi:hypothetical protein
VAAERIGDETDGGNYNNEADVSSILAVKGQTTRRGKTACNRSVTCSLPIAPTPRGVAVFALSEQDSMKKPQGREPACWNNGPVALKLMHSLKYSLG